MVYTRAQMLQQPNSTSLTTHVLQNKNDVSSSEDSTPPLPTTPRSASWSLTPERNILPEADSDTQAESVEI